MAELPPIKARVIVEVAGWPEAHITDTLALVEKNFGSNRDTGIKVEKATVREPKKISDRAFSGYVDFEFTAKKLTDLVGVVFDWMPSTVEIFEPKELMDTNSNFTDLLNDMAAKLHQYDALIKRLKSANILLQKDLYRLNSKVLKKNEDIKNLKKDKLSKDEELNDFKDKSS